MCFHSIENHGLSGNDGSSAILFGWRFTPTLIAVLYAQMTVILFEDVKRTEPFARLAKAPKEGTSAYGTILQTPRAWWSIFTDTCFRRKSMGKTSWSLVCAALVNLIALLAISPLSSALLTSEEIRIPKPTEFTRLVPKDSIRLPDSASRDTYFRTMAALMRNISTSAWVTDTTLTLPFWPSTEVAKLGPKLTSSYDGWSAESTTLMSGYDCQEMKLESAEMSEEPYSDVWDVMVRYPRKGTQPMVTFVLSSTQGCTYELMMHPIVDLAYNGGITWSNATTFFPQQHTLPLGAGTHPIPPNVTSTHVYARLNASKQCDGHDIIIMNTPWTAPVDYTPFKTSPWIPENMTYERSADFRMQGMLCQSHYSISKDNINAVLAESVGNSINASAQGNQNIQDLPESLLNIDQVQRKTMTDEWRTYFDRETMRLDALQAAGPDLAPPWAARFPGYSGLAPMLAVLSDFDLVSLMNDKNIVQTAARVKGRFFTEMIRETLNSPTLFQTNTVMGTATVVQERVVVLVEIGFALAALFFASAVLFVAIFWTSRLSHRPLKLSSDPSSIVGLSLLLQPHLVKNATFRKMHNDSREDLYKSLRKESYLTSDNYLIQGTAQPGMLKCNNDGCLLLTKVM